MMLTSCLLTGGSSVQLGALWVVIAELPHGRWARDIFLSGDRHLCISRDGSATAIDPDKENVVFSLTWDLLAPLIGGPAVVLFLIETYCSLP